MRSYLLSESVKNDVQNSIPLVIYLLGHGSSSLNNGRFYLNKDEYLSPDTLAAWLDSYGDLELSSQIIVILDFCYSGTFLPKLRSAYTQNRIVISSSDGSNAAYFAWGKVSAGISGMRYTQEKTSPVHSVVRFNGPDFSAPGANKANPLINCDNNGTYNNSLDMDIAKNVYIGGSQQLQALTADFDTVWGEETSQGLAVTVRANGEFNSVWCRLYSSDYDLSSVGVPSAVILEKTDDSTWTGVYTGSRAVGVYTAVLEGVNVNDEYVMGGYADVRSTVTSVTIRSGKFPLKQFIRVSSGGPDVIMKYGLPVNSNVKITVFNILGKKLEVVDQGFKNAGIYSVKLNRNRTGIRNGVLIFRLSTDNGENIVHFSILK